MATDSFWGHNDDKPRAARNGEKKRKEFHQGVTNAPDDAGLD